MPNHVLVVNGPNINLVGTREPEIYGSETLADAQREASAVAKDLGLTCAFVQSNHEGQLIDWIQEARTNAQGIIINPGGYTHTSIALLDVLKAFDGPVIELHITNVHKREAFRRKSFVSERSDGVIAGFGIHGYSLAMQRMGRLLIG